MRILCLTDFEIPRGRCWLWEHVPGNQDEISFRWVRSTDRYKKWGKLLSSYPKYLGFAWKALKETQAGDYDLVVAWESDTGLPLAFFRRVLRHKTPPLIVLTFSVRGPLSHFRPLLRFASQGIDYMTVPTKIEQDLYAEYLEFSKDRIIHYPFGTYDVFGDQVSSLGGSFIFSGGRSERDYKTLLEAVTGLDIPVVINARPFNLRGLSIPANVKVNDILPLEQFRDLNLGSKFVVVPIENVNQAAGITSVLYAMAAGKAVIASDVPGLHDYLIENKTGLFVPPHNADKLRLAIQTLWDNPAMASQMGSAARKEYLEHHTFEAFAKRTVRILQDLMVNRD